MQRLWQSSLSAVLSVAIVSGCAGVRPGVFAATDSSNSGASADSAGASGNSANSSNTSAGSSNNSSPNTSFQTSSNNSTAESSNATSKNSGAISVAVGSTTVVGGTSVGLGFLIWALVVKGGAGAAAAAPAATAFLRANERQLRMDLALGAGRSIDDLAALAQIRREHLPRFAAILQSHREELLRLANPEALGPQRALEVFARIGALARSDGLLAEDFRAFQARHPES